LYDIYLAMLISEYGLRPKQVWR